MKELTATEKDRCVELLRKLVDPSDDEVFGVIDEAQIIFGFKQPEPPRIPRTRGKRATRYGTLVKCHLYGPVPPSQP